MYHSLMETDVGFGKNMPKPNFNTHVTIIKVYLRRPDFFVIS